MTKDQRISIGRTNARILSGEEDLSIWSDEELRRGQRKSKRGRWEGRGPAIVPKKLHDELVKRTLDEAAQVLRDNVVDAVTLLGTVVRDKEASNGDRLKAAEMIMKHTLPREPIAVSVEVRTPFMEMLEGSVASLDGDTVAVANTTEYLSRIQQDHEVVTGELVDD